MHTVAHDEIRDLIAKGWVPPPHALEPYRHLLAAYYKGRGWASLAEGEISSTSAETLCALIGMFERLGLEVPPAPEPLAEAA